VPRSLPTASAPMATLGWALYTSVAGVIAPLPSAVASTRFVPLPRVVTLIR